MASVIFSGNSLKALLPGLQLGANATVWSGSLDPSSSGFIANQGDVYLSTSTHALYVKTGSGDTNWSKSMVGVSFTDKSIVFADSSGNLTQDNSNFKYDSSTHTLTVTGPAIIDGKIQLGTVDAFTNNQIVNYNANSKLYLGSWQADNAPDNTNVTSEGIVVYGNSVSNPLSFTDGGFARIKSDRFALYTQDSTTGLIGDYWRTDPTHQISVNNDGDTTFQVVRSTGATTVGSLTDNSASVSTVPYYDASKKLVSSSVTPTELGYVHGVSSDIQTQISAKLNLSGGTMSGDINMNTHSLTNVGSVDTPSSGTLTVGGTNASTINIGHSGATVNIVGDVAYENVTNLQVTDALITLNKGGGAGSASASGVELEEGGSITGYAKTSGDRNSWTIKAPATAGIATVTPGSGGITLDQSSHNPVTIGSFGSTPNNDGLSLSTQAVNLQPADSTHPGSVSISTQSFGGGKTIIGNADEVQLTVKGNGTQTGNLAEFKNSSNTLEVAITKTGQIQANEIYAFGSGDIVLTTGSIYDNIGNKKIDWFSGYLNATSASLSIDWVNRALKNSSGTTVFDYSGTNPSLNSNKLTNVTDPTSNQDAATKAYVDNVAAGINPAVATQAATTSSSDTSGFTYNNGVSGIGAFLTAPSNNTAITIDGYTFTALGQRLLVKDHSTAAYNGVYYVTQLQAALLPVIFTRSLDFDMPSDINNTGAIPVINGTVNGTTQWVVSSSVTTVGSDAITFTKFARNPADYLLKSSGDINETSFSAANNQSSAANVTGLAFANGTVRAAQILLSVYVDATSPLYEFFTLNIIQKASSWNISATSVGDASGFAFTITNAGAIQYTNSNYSGFNAATVKFRALSTSV